jgi:sugar (pentulose or hexulose) kinase
MEEYVLSIDCGTQSIRALLFDKNARCTSSEKTNRFLHIARSRLYEADAEKFTLSKRSLSGRRSREPEKYGKIAVVALTALRDSSVLVDESGKPVRKAIIWHDNRVAQNSGPGPDAQHRFCRCGNARDD